MDKEYAVCGIGHALVDLLIRVDQADFLKLGLERAKTSLLNSQEQAALLAILANYQPEMLSGGSIANSVVALAQLGSKAAFVGTLGCDQFGDVFAQQFDDLGIELAGRRLVDQPTGTCLAIITTDAERTMCTCLGASSDIALDQQAQHLIKDSKWLFLEGFTLTSANAQQQLILPALEIAKASQTKVAFSFSEAWVVEAFRESVESIVAESSLIFCNEAEAKRFTHSDDLETAFSVLKEKCPGVVLTAGSQGALVWYNEQEVRVPACLANPVDLTGAGDMFAGTFLHGVITQTAPEVSAKRACYMAKKIIEQIGARLKQEVPSDFFESIIV